MMIQRLKRDKGSQRFRSEVNVVKLRDESGFSLIELALVIIILGILTATAMQSLTVAVEDAKTVGTERELKALADAIVGDANLAANGVRSDFGFVGDNGAFPSNLDALIANPGLATWNGPYFKNRLEQNLTGYKNDEWGKPYTYSGSILLSSSGGPKTITKKVADATSDYLLNTINGVILDGAGSAPGPIYDDSIIVEITFPDGSGALQTKGYRPDIAGQFTLDSIPVGQHPLNIIYEPNVDTLYRYLTVLPRHRSGTVSYRFNSDYFNTDTSGSGGPGTPGSEILRPSGVGTYTNLESENCSQNWQCVDEVTSDGDGTYVKGSGNSWKTDSYQTENSLFASGLIDSVAIWIRCKGPGGNMWSRTFIRTNGADFNGADMLHLNSVSSYTDYSTTYVTNPATSSPWTWTEINAIEIGIGARRESKNTQLWLVVYYID